MYSVVMETQLDKRAALVKAIAIVGTQSALARRLGKTQPHIAKWLRSKHGVPAEYCPAIERLTNGKVRCEELNDRADWAYLRTTSPPSQPSPSPPLPRRRRRRDAQGEVVLRFLRSGCARE